MYRTHNDSYGNRSSSSIIFSHAAASNRKNKQSEQLTLERKIIKLEKDDRTCYLERECYVQKKIVWEPSKDLLHRIVDSLTHRWRSRRTSLHRLAASALGTSTTIEARNATGSHHFLHSNALQVLLCLELGLNVLVSLQQPE